MRSQPRGIELPLLAQPLRLIRLPSMDHRTHLNPSCVELV